MRSLRYMNEHSRQDFDLVKKYVFNNSTCYRGEIEKQIINRSCGKE